MKRKGNNKLFVSFAIFLLLFSLINPIFTFAESDSKTKTIGVDENILQMKELVNKQIEMLDQEVVLHASLQDLSGSEKVDVIVQLSEHPVALEKGKGALQGKIMTASEEATIINKIKSQQASFERELVANNVNFEKGFTYQHAINGISLKVNASDVDTLAGIPGVVLVEPDEKVYAFQDVSPSSEMHAFMNTTNDFLGIHDFWDMGIEGEGVKVAVLDTGIDYDHPDFEGIYKGGFNFVPHDSSYARDRADDDPYETSPLDRAPNSPEYSGGLSFYTTHGTHVAGTIAAIGANEYGVKGIAPKIDLYAYRVLGAYGSGQFSWIIAGIDKSIEEEMDIINLSLGGSSNSSTTADAIALNNATLAGVTAVVATGNSGPGRGSIGNPASSPLAISVGNSTSPQMTIESDVEVEAGGYSAEYTSALMGWTFGSDPQDTLSGTFDVVAVPNVGSNVDYVGLDVEGKVALVSRGSIPFVEKVMVAKNQGAVGIIIYNNLPGDGPSDIYLGDAFEMIPTFDISYEDGIALRDAILDTAEELGQVTFSNYNYGATAGDDVNSSSSRGPTTPYFDIKPDVVAPGTNIMSTVPAFKRDFPDASYDQAFERYTGTSMATPHIAGIAALLLSANPEMTPFDLKVALSNTAKQLEVSQYDVFTQGPGRVQPMKALTAEALAYALDTVEHEGEMVPHEKGTVTFGSVVPSIDEEQTITREIKVRSFVESSEQYSVSVQTTKNATGDMADANVTVNKSSFDLSGEETLEVTLTVPSGTGSSGNELFGYIHISNGTTDLLLPFAAEFVVDGGLSGVAYYYLDDYAISPNGNGHFEDTSLYFGLYDNQDGLIIELYDLSDPFGGPFGDGYIGYFGAGSLSAGDYVLPIDGQYIDWEDGEEKLIPEGAYTIDLVQYAIFPDLLAWDGPFYVKTSDPVVSLTDVEDEIDASEYTITGMVDDKFIEFKESVESILGPGYDVNNKLSVTYSLENESGDTVDNGELSLEQDGTFELTLTNLSNGENTVTVYVEDIVALTGEGAVTFIVNKEEDEEPSDFNITLTPSTTEPTEGPVVITVDTDSEEDLVSLKWLDGEKSVEDFDGKGTEIDLGTKSFEVSDNSVYTVFAENSVGVKAISTIEISNIEEPVIPINLSLTPSTTEPTEGSVVITVETDDNSSLVSLKWLSGEKTKEDFSDNGNDILETKSFEVQSNGVFSVYAKNDSGTEEVKTIAITNIVVPDEPISITLTPSTTEPTEGPVSISVTVETEAELEELKWLPGEKGKEDFADAGNDILEEKAFDVTNNGVYTVFAKNSDGVEKVSHIIIENIVEPEPEPSVPTIVTTPSTIEPTEGPVTISVSVESDDELAALKWLAGEKSVEDFADAGNDILETKTFDVTENGVYTVYVATTKGVEVVTHVSVENIVEPEQEPAPISISLSYSPSEETEGPVTVSVDVETDAELVSLKWQAGEKSVEDFAESGEDILDTKSFDVTENGVYTVYALNDDGVEEVLTIAIDNIVEPKPDDPKPEDPKPEDPKPEDPKPEDPKPEDPKPEDPKPEDPKQEEKDKTDKGTDEGKLPSTSTSIYNFLALGLLLASVGTILVTRRFRKRVE